MSDEAISDDKIDCFGPSALAMTGFSPLQHSMPEKLRPRGIPTPGGGCVEIENFLFCKKSVDGFFDADRKLGLYVERIAAVLLAFHYAVIMDYV